VGASSGIDAPRCQSYRPVPLWVRRFIAASAPFSHQGARLGRLAQFPYAESIVMRR